MHDNPMAMTSILRVLVSFALTAAASAQQVSIDLTGWTTENYGGAASGGNWSVNVGGTSVTQTQNGQPTMFVGDFQVYNLVLEGDMTTGGSDDDFLGFALGFVPSDMTNAAADYLLIDWKRGAQSYNFSSCSVGGLAPAGLAVSRVTGIATDDEFWQHTDYNDPCSPLGQGLTELQRGLTLGATGWSPNTTYHFQFTFTPTSLEVYVDNVLEIDITGSFADGRFAFYNFSQANTTYSALTQALAATAVPYGIGCPGGTPLVLTSDTPELGGTWTLQGSGLEPVSPFALFWFGNLQINPGVDLGFAGAPGCFGYTNGNLGIYTGTLTAGVSNTPIGIPSALPLYGTEIFVQMSGFTNSNALGVTTSNGMAGRIGL
ncbi:MAG: hypothetical protein ACJA0V_003276 [Planctomycetota bacterium]|jgi:hypothetical protein